MSAVSVQLWIGSYSCPRAVADVFLGDTLTITSIDDGSVIREFPAGDWTSVTVIDDRGFELYTHTATTPLRQLHVIPITRSREGCLVKR